MFGVKASITGCLRDCVADLEKYEGSVFFFPCRMIEIRRIAKIIGDFSLEI